MDAATPFQAPPGVTFDSFLDQAWDDHADRPQAVAQRAREQGLALAGSEGDLTALAHLLAHTLGDHLARWAEAQQALQALAAHPLAGAAVQADLALRQQALQLAGGDDTVLQPLQGATRVRVLALAAGHVLETDSARAADWLSQAWPLADELALAPPEPACRTLAAQSNNVAAALCEMTARSDTQTRLMLDAAHAARRWWAVAGTWVHVERAELRLSACWLAAGDALQARAHALAALELLQVNAGSAEDRFEAVHALALAERAAGYGEAYGQAVWRLHQAFAELPPEAQARQMAVLQALGPQGPGAAG